MRVGMVLCLVAAVSASGCFSELLASEERTARTFACAVVDPGDGRDVLLALHREEGVARERLEALWDLVQGLADAGVGGDRIRAAEVGLFADESPWTLERLRIWADDAEVLGDREVTLHVLWVHAFADEAVTTVLVAPGVVAVSEAAVQAGAARLERSETFLARVLLFHVVGHALGAVNMGIPLNGTDPAAQEGPPGHEPALDSVLHVGWERVATMPRTNATYDGYSQSVLEDWRAAPREDLRMTKLYEDALRLSINENLRNIRTILEWAKDAPELQDAIAHSEQAYQLLGEVVTNLRELGRA